MALPGGQSRGARPSPLGGGCWLRSPEEEDVKTDEDGGGRAGSAMAIGGGEAARWALGYSWRTRPGSWLLEGRTPGPGRPPRRAR